MCPVRHAAIGIPLDHHPLDDVDWRFSILSCINIVLKELYGHLQSSLPCYWCYILLMLIMLITWLGLLTLWKGQWVNFISMQYLRSKIMSVWCHLLANQNLIRPMGFFSI
jgi:hypothetical protein